MEKAFSPSNPILKFNNLANQSDKDEQKGFMKMFSRAPCPDLETHERMASFRMTRSGR